MSMQRLTLVRGVPVVILGTVMLLSPSCSKPSEPGGETTGSRATSGGDVTAGEDLPRMARIPDFSFTDQTGVAYGSDAVAGKVWVANFIFTRCPATCPLQTKMMSMLQGRLDEMSDVEDVRLVSFSVDPTYDRPPILLEYARAAQADPWRWRFLTGARDAIWNLSKDGFKLAVGDAPVNAASPLFHSPMLVLVDRNGYIRKYYDGTTEEGVGSAADGVASLVAEEATERAAGSSWTMAHADQAADAAQVSVPEEVFTSPWMERRRAAQLETTVDLQVQHDFSFKDVLPVSGIAFVNRVVDDASVTYKAAHYDHGTGIAVADVDGDGLLDVYFVCQAGANMLCRNNGDGTFTDITKSAGVGVSVPIGVAAAFADIDNDGDPDLYVTTVRGGNYLFRNDGSGVFEDISESAGVDYSGHSSAAVFFDFDRDGRLDLFVTNVGKYTSDLPRPVTNDNGLGEGDGVERTFYSAYEDAFAGQLKPERTEKSILYRNINGQRFEDVTVEVGLDDGSWSGDASPLDVNCDGWIDLYVLNMQGNDEYFENNEGVFVRRSREVFPQTPWGSMGIKVFDWDNDGDQDIFITDMHSDMSIDVGPQDEKLKARMEWPESFLQTQGASIFGNAFYRNLGNGEFEEISDVIGAENYWPWGLSVGDLNADGFEDVFVASSMNYPFRYGVNSVLLNNRGDRFVDSEFILGVEPRRGGEVARPVFTLDCSGDDFGHLDCKGREGTITVWGALGTRSSVILDFDMDGDLDIITNEFNGPPMVLVSDLAARHEVHFLTVALEGTRSNRDGLGATVRVKAGSTTWTKVHDGQSGYLSQSAMPLYFGLGDVDVVDEIEVTWPSGHQQRISGPIASGTRLQIIEQ